MRYACVMDTGIIWKPKVVVETSPTCPRCGSNNTKFCYYNNYSLTQPRYFCKSCRRYWTKGGSLRNVPVGGGCRKSVRSRSSSSSGGNYKHINNNIRASSSIHQDDVVLGHVNIINSSRNYFSNTTTATGSLAPPVTDADDNGRPNIDLALVYANFLNPELLPNNNNNNNVAGPPPPLPVPQLPPPQFHTSSVFLECVSFSDGLSSENEHVTTRDGNIDPFNYFGGGMNSFDGEKQQQTTTFRDHLHVNNSNEDYLLLAPPNHLTGEEMVWPSSDLICPRDPVIDAAFATTTRFKSS